MPVLCLGVSHQSAPVALREALALDRGGVERVLVAWDRERAWREGVAEVALISTCNRTELYLASRGPGEHFTGVPAVAEDLLLRPLAGRSGPVRAHLYDRHGPAAVGHLCRVAAGLESMVVGESEVLGQVVAAHGLAADAGTTGIILDAAFRAAIRAGRRARAETGIGRAAASVASEGVRLLDTQLAAIERPRIVVVGSGAMARLVTELLARRPAGSLTVVGRSAHRAATVAREASVTAGTLGELPRLLRDADALVSMTTAPEPVITADLVRQMLPHRNGATPLVCLDLAMPRDIDPAVRTLAGVRLFDLDDLQARVADNRRAREAERPRVEAIIEQEVSQFQAWLHGAELRPILAAMHARGEQIRQREVAQLLRRHPDADPAVREAVDQLSRAIVAKLLHGPSARLRTETDPERCQHYVSALQHLFGLGDGDRLGAAR